MTVRFLKDHVMVPMSAVPDLAAAIESHRQRILHEHGLYAAEAFSKRWRSFLIEASLVEATGDLLSLYDDDENQENSDGGHREVMNCPDRSDDLVPAADLAAQADVSTTYVNRLCRTGKLRAQKVDGQWLISPDAAAVFLANRPTPKETTCP